MDEIEEIEVKLALPAREVAKLRRSPFWRGLKDGGSRTLLSTYFDSPARHLFRNGFTLRQRRGDDTAEQTLKWDGAEHNSLSRTEWTWPLEEPTGELRELSAVKPLQRLDGFDSADLQPLCEVEYRRALRFWQDGDTTVELALDIGAINAAGRSAPLSELELELKAGDPATLFALARQINAFVTVCPSIESKGARGLSLASGEPAVWHKPTFPALDKAMSLDAAIASIVSTSLEHLLLNLPCARSGDHVEGIHQMRVAIRRLRSVLKMVRPVLESGREASLNDRLKALASELGPVRDLDVFHAVLLPAARPAVANELAFEKLDRLIGRMRSDAQARACAALTAPAFGALMIDLLEWTSLRTWRDQPKRKAAPKLFAPARKTVGGRLDKLHRHVRRRGRNFVSLESEGRHELRIAIKQLRYAIDLLGGLYPKNRVTAYRRQLSALQDRLGNDNDVLAATAIIEQVLKRRPGSAVVLAAGEVLGWLRHEADARDRTVVKDWTRFRAATPPWKN